MEEYYAKRMENVLRRFLDNEGPSEFGDHQISLTPAHASALSGITPLQSYQDHVEGILTDYVKKWADMCETGTTDRRLAFNLLWRAKVMEPETKWLFVSWRFRGQTFYAAKRESSLASGRAKLTIESQEAA